MSQSMAHEKLIPSAGAPPRPTNGWWAPVWRRFRASLGTALVMSALGGLGYWGYRTDWTFPTFAELTSGVATTEEAWCEEHDVPEAACIECQPGLAPKGKGSGWCKRHGVAPCPWDDPAAAQLRQTPEVSPEDMARAERALKLRPRAENNPRCTLHERRIQFASAAAADKAGIEIDVAARRPIVEAIAANGEIVYDQTRFAHLASRVAGTVWHVYKQVGEEVRRGDLLLLVDSTEVGRAKEELLQAVVQRRLKRTTVDRLKPLVAEKLVIERQYREAVAANEDAEVRLQSARQKLVNLGLAVRASDLADLTMDEVSREIQFLGLPAEVADELDPETTSSNLLPVTSPLDGVVIDRDVVEGELVTTDTKLFSVGDVTRMWLLLDVRQEDVPQLALGQPVLFTADEEASDAELRGAISWISTAADDRTRTVKVRVDLPNADGRLRANTFGQGRIVLREEPEALAVPSEAVHWDGCCHVVFVRDKDYLKPDAPKFFHVRKVRPGVQADDQTEIIAGLLPGEVIASKNSVVLEAQLLKSNLGDGCACGH